MSKNLVVLHLESVSQSSLWQFMEELQTLWKLSTRSAFFRRFYTASTSSVMSMCDIMHGDSAELDHNARFPRDKKSLAGRSSNLFRTLLHRGYMTKGVQYGSFCVGDAPNNFWGVWPDECGAFEWHDQFTVLHDEARDFMTRAKEKGNPFALYFWSMATHVRSDLEGAAEMSFHERFRHGYRLLDKSVKRLLDDMAELGVLEDTLILVYGDHGDDFWRHGFNKGRTHVIEPYSNLCWTPLFIFNNDNDIGIYDSVASSTDIKATVLHMLFPDSLPEERATPFAGIDIIRESRQLAFSQSIFALQMEYSDPAKAVTKSYAVTDGELRLMVSSGGGDIENHGGMELFIEQWDYGNTRNMLDFFTLDGAGNIVSFDCADMVHPHFRLSFTKERVTSLVQAYIVLRQSLMNFIQLKESEALKQLSAEEENQLFPMDAFTGRRRKQW